MIPIHIVKGLKLVVAMTAPIIMILVIHALLHGRFRQTRDRPSA